MAHYYKTRAVMWLTLTSGPNNRMSYAVATNSAALNMVEWFLS